MSRERELIDKDRLLDRIDSEVCGPCMELSRRPDCTGCKVDDVIAAIVDSAPEPAADDVIVTENVLGERKWEHVLDADGQQTGEWRYAGTDPLDALEGRLRQLESRIAHVEQRLKENEEERE